MSASELSFCEEAFSVLSSVVFEVEVEYKINVTFGGRLGYSRPQPKSTSGNSTSLVST